VENIEKAVTEQLKAIPVSDYQRCYEDWEQRLRRCVAFQGNYFEEDKLDLWFKSNYRVTLNQSHYFIYRLCITLTKDIKSHIYTTTRVMILSLY